MDNKAILGISVEDFVKFIRAGDIWVEIVDDTLLFYNLRESLSNHTLIFIWKLNYKFFMEIL